MANPPREIYFRKLKQELNPSIFVGDILSHIVMNVEWSLDEDAEVVVSACVNGSAETLQTRGLGANVVRKVVDAAPFSEIAKAELEIVFKNPKTTAVSCDPENLALLSIYCFLHVAFAAGA